MKYETINGVQCTPEENSLISSLERLARRWEKDGKDLMLFSWAGSLVVLKKSEIGKHTEDAVVARILGIPNDGGDPD